MASVWPLSPVDSHNNPGPQDPPVNDRSLARSRIFQAIKDRDFDTALIHSRRLSRMEPASAPDLAIAATPHLVLGNLDATRVLLDKALGIDPCYLMAAKARTRISAPLSSDALRCLCWHAETDTETVHILLAQVGLMGTPLAFVAARKVHCILPPGEWRVAMNWRNLTLAAAELPSAESVRVVALGIPDPLRGIVNPTVLVNGTALPQPAIAASHLAAPRLRALVEADDDGSWIVRALDDAAPERPVAILVRNQDQVIARHVSEPVTGHPPTDPVDVPPIRLALPLDPDAPPALYFELTGEPLGVPVGILPFRAPDDGVVDVVVPVHGDYDSTYACFDALLNRPPGTPMRVIAIDDASPDPRISAMLDQLAAGGHVHLIRNPGNLGFVRSVNVGMAISQGRDILLLNADTVVAAGWLGRLRAAALAEARTGTVTPWSNDATICSYPAANNPTALPTVDVAGLDRVAAEALAGQTALIPTAVGFCMYIRRDCLNQTGWFDAQTFGTGYGEENDFCLRTRAFGWQHRIALDCFVGHVGSTSFGAAKMARVKSALAQLEAGYPGYDAEIQRFIAADPLSPFRRHLDFARAQADDATYPIVILCARLGGGTDRFVDQRVSDIQNNGGRALLLRPERDPADGGLTLRLEVPGRVDLPNLTYDPGNELDVLEADLVCLGVQMMELHHMSGLTPSLLTRLASWFPYTTHIHDYGWVCPRYNLIDGTGRYCGEPDDATCDRCVAENGADLDIGISVGAWRALTRKVLEGAKIVGCSAPGTATRMHRYAPAARFAVRPAESGNPPLPVPPRRSMGEILRIVVPGAIGPSKGYDVLLACAQDAASRDLPLQFLVLGYSRDDAALIATGRVDITGRYDESEASTLLAELRPHLAFLPSVWPETWCYALSHVMNAGLLVAAFDMGAQSERLRTLGAGYLLPANMQAADVNNAFLSAFPAS